MIIHMVYVLNLLMYSYFQLSLPWIFGHTTNVWIGLQNDDYEKWLNGAFTVSYSNWSPFDTINAVSFKKLFFISHFSKRSYLIALFTEVLFLLVCCQYIFNNVISYNFHAFHRCKYSSQYCYFVGYKVICEQVY